MPQDPIASRVVEFFFRRADGTVVFWKRASSQRRRLDRSRTLGWETRYWIGLLARISPIRSPCCTIGLANTPEQSAEAHWQTQGSSYIFVSDGGSFLKGRKSTIWKPSFGVGENGRRTYVCLPVAQGGKALGSIDSVFPKSERPPAVHPVGLDVAEGNAVSFLTPEFQYLYLASVDEGEPESTLWIVRRTQIQANDAQSDVGHERVPLAWLGLPNEKRAFEECDRNNWRLGLQFHEGFVAPRQVEESARTERSVSR